MAFKDLSDGSAFFGFGSCSLLVYPGVIHGKDGVYWRVFGEGNDWTMGLLDVGHGWLSVDMRTPHN